MFLGLAVALSTSAAAQLAPAVRQFVVHDEPVIALVDVRVIDGTGAIPREHQTIVIRGGKIVAFGGAGQVDVPTGAARIDLAGKTVIPGLFDLHAHQYFYSAAGLTEMSVSAPRLYLGGGVTSARTAGGQMPYADLSMKTEIDRGHIAGPRLEVTGPYLDGPGNGTVGLNRRLETEAEARRVVAYWASEGATWLKFQGRVSRAVLGAAIDEAHKHGMKVTGHLCSVSFREAAALGIDNLEHGFITNSDYIPNKQPDQCPAENMRYQAQVDVEGPEVDATIRDLLARKVALTSTLSVYEMFVAERAALPADVLDAMAPKAREAAERELAELKAGTSFAVPKVLFQKMMRFERRWVAAGGLLAAGVDPWGNGSLPGYGDHRNFEVLVEAGFTPVEAIQIMTQNGAKVMGVNDRLGSVTVGKLADLVVLDGDPVLHPSDIRKVSLVFKDGVGYDAAKLRASVRGMVGIQ